ncbi:sodium-dependent transporter [Methanococcus voltae]|uniref:NSS family neurotransmitter:Na+ symporter n=2 Tax=Methanococcus voltae TaxID=2188 RepID=A0A8J7S540_METVO|nr:sodium-dependent transporter [Methanococcus voltae]MBP2172550.1 NSS family neurotransmitter:Na+ symporter [Methanococcus voltae]MBP2201543.1 NSS family neurotransmitter:Na+ symporter [Methanococcus voltae]MCS3922332.1 NSS family neurotransmitter:Na+ symporter [Methanococcus voltae PS]
MTRETWNSKRGFIATAIGSAVGLGNIWMFPWRVGTEGGAAFLIPYIILLVSIGIVALTVEWTLGRMTKGGPVVAFEKAGLPFGKYFGILGNFTMFLVFAFYSLIIGWMIMYLSNMLFGGLSAVDAGQFLASQAFSPSMAMWQFVGIAITIFIVSKGVKRGIEKANNFMTPVLYILLILLTINSLMLPGVNEGLSFYLLPDMEKLFSPGTWMIALSQMFFSLSCLGTTMVVYGSYLKEKEDIPVSAVVTAFGDTLVAFLAGLIIFPAVFSFGFAPEAGPTLIFAILPEVFQQMPGGLYIGILFFLALLFAGITSSVSMLEVCVEAVMSKTNISRTLAAIGLGLAVFLVSLPSLLGVTLFGMPYFDFIIYISTVLIGPLGALLAALALGKIGIDKAYEHIQRGASVKIPKIWKPWAKYFYPIVVLVIYLYTLVNGG